jgi:putative transcriptional regulator
MAKTLSTLTEALLETADDMHSVGLMGDDTYRKITVRHLGPDAPPRRHLKLCTLNNDFPDIM